MFDHPERVPHAFEQSLPYVCGNPEDSVQFTEKVNVCSSVLAKAVMGVGWSLKTIALQTLDAGHKNGSFCPSGPKTISAPNGISFKVEKGVESQQSDAQVNCTQSSTPPCVKTNCK